MCSYHINLLPLIVSILIVTVYFCSCFNLHAVLVQHCSFLHLAHASSLFSHIVSPLSTISSVCPVSYVDVESNLRAFWADDHQAPPFHVAIPYEALCIYDV